MIGLWSLPAYGPGARWPGSRCQWNPTARSIVEVLAVVGRTLVGRPKGVSSFSSVLASYTLYKGFPQVFLHLRVSHKGLWAFMSPATKTSFAVLNSGTRSLSVASPFGQYTEMMFAFPTSGRRIAPTTSSVANGEKLSGSGLNISEIRSATPPP